MTRSTCPAWALCAGLLVWALAVGGLVAAPRGAGLAYALTNSGNTQLAQLLDTPGIDGVALQEGWAAIETANGTFSYTRLDAALNLVKARGKQASLHLLAAPYQPAWLAQAGAQFYTVQTPNGPAQRIVPWDPVYRAQYAEFLQALAQHLAAAGLADTVFDVSAVVPIGEMNLVDCRNNLLGTSLAYSRTSYVQAWKSAIDSLQAAFPNARKFLSPEHEGLICAPAVDHTVYTEILDYALATHGNRFWVFAADLNADGSTRTSDVLGYASSTTIGYQTIWSATDDPNHRMGGTYPGNLKVAVCRGLANGASYFELYAVDVLNPEPQIQDAILAVHDPASCDADTVLADGFE